MDTTAKIVWHAFLQSSPQDRRSALLRCLSPELSKELEHLPTCSHDPRKGIEPLEEFLSQIHFSWLAPFLRSLPENEIKLFLCCLTPEQIKGLKQSLLLSNTLPSPTSIGKTYLKKTLFDQIADTELIPISCLPADPLNVLLELSSEELSSMIDLLSMHDLSIEIKHVIETTKLKQIHGLLSKAQMTFLKTLLHKKEPVSFKKMGLLNWKGDPEALRSMLLQRGINRIAKALYGRDPSLLWHVAHRLDSEKGQLLINLCTALDHPRASLLLSEQVIELINALKHNNPPQSL
jgi:hypothetical protein